MTTKTLEKFAIPLSIIFAGLLIGVAVIITNKPATPSIAGVTTEVDLMTELTKNPVVKQLKIKEKELVACIEGETTSGKVQNDMQLANQAGLRGTPHMVAIMPNGDQFPLFGALPKEMILSAITEGKTPAEQAEMVEANIPQQIITENDHVRGNRDTALATIVEYSDIDCPYCKQLHSTLQQLVNEGKIAWVYRHSPIEQLHPTAYTKSIASECVANLSNTEGFWKYIDSMMKN